MDARLKNIGLALGLALLVTFSACTIVGSSDSEKLLITLEGRVFEADDTATIQITNKYSQDVFVHNQSSYALQQFVDNEWVTVYTPIADTGGTPRFFLFIEAGDERVFQLPVLPESGLYETGFNKFRFAFGLFFNQDISQPLPANQRVTPTFTVIME